MTQPRTDHNDLARFLDGSLSEEERSRALANLSASDDDADVLADAAYLLRELEDGVVIAETGGDADADPAAPDMPADTDAAGGDPQVIPLRPPSTQRARRRVPVQWLALAAVLAGVLLVPLAMSRIRSPYPGDPSQLAILLEDGGTGLREDWSSGWSGKRGKGSVGADEVRAARLGALLLDLQIATNGRQTEQTAYWAGQIRTLAEDLPAPGLVTPTYDSIAARAGAPPEELVGLLQDGYDYITDVVDKDYFAAGAWVEAARIALENGDTAFFQSRTTRTALSRMGKLTMAEEAHTALNELRTSIRGEPAPDWTTVTNSLDVLGGELWR